MKVAILPGALLGAALAALALTSCGSASKGLKPVAGTALPVAPYGAPATPTPKELLTPTSQARPQRSDDLLTNSIDRRSDEFDLPPSN